MTEAVFDRPSTFWEKLLFPVRSIHPQKLADTVRHKTILITGATYGIGENLADKLSACPAELILVARTREKLETLQQQWAGRPAKIHLFPADLRDEQQVDRLVSSLRERGLEPDILISNAGHSIYRPLLQSLDRYHDTKRSAAINYLGPVQLLLGLLPNLLQKKGHVINVSSVTQHLPHAAGWSAYYSSKAAFDDWLRCAEPELRAAGAGLSQVYLPLVRTRMSMMRAQDLKRFSLSAEEAAVIILHCLVKKRRKYLPWCIGIPRLLHVLLPGVWLRMQTGRLKRKKK